MSCLEEIHSADLENYVNEITTRITEDTVCVTSGSAGERPTEYEACETQDCPFYQTSSFGEVELDQ